MAKKRDPNLVHVVFHNSETGRFAFHGWWPKGSVEKIKLAARLLGISEEEFIHRALDEYEKNHPIEGK